MAYLFNNCIAFISLINLADAIFSLPTNSSNSAYIYSAPNKTTPLTVTQYSECWSTIGYESDGIPTPGSTACSCTALLTSAEASYGAAESYFNNFASTWVTTMSLDLPLPASYPIPENCCVKCGVTAMDVRLLFWPIETSAKNATNKLMTATSTPYGLVSDGFTFISPSVYVAYNGLAATSYCIEFGEPSVGKTYNTMIAYAPEALSTSQESEFYAGTRFYTAINYTLLQHPTTVTSYGPFQGTTPQVYFSLPADLSLVDPAWEGCLPDEYGAFDPPRTLGTASALVSQDLGTEPSLTPSPGSPIAPAHIPATATPGPKKPVGNDPQPAYPAPDGADSGTESDAKQTPDPSKPDPPDLSIAKPQTPDSPKPADPPTGPAINSASISAILQDLPNGENKAQGPPESPYPAASGSSGRGDPGGRIGDDPNDNSETYQNTNSGQSPADPVQPVSSTAGRQTEKVADSGAVHGDNGEVFQLTATTTAGPVLIAGQSVVRASSGGLVIGSLTIASGSQKIVSGHTVSAGLSSILIDGSIYALPTSVGATLLQSTVPPVGPVLIAGQSVVRAPSGGLVIGSLTIASGSQVTISGHTISAGFSSVFIDGSTYTLSTSIGAMLSQPKIPLASPVLIAGQSIVRDSSGGLIIESSTVASGSQVTISGHIVSAGFSSVLIDGNTYALPTSVGAILQQSPNLQAITLANGAIISAGGTPATLSGTTYSVASDGGDLIANGKTMPFPTKPQSVFTIAGKIFTAAPTGFVAAGDTVALDGSAVTIDGTVVSLGPSGLQIGSSMIPLDVAEETAEAGLGGLILSGFGGAPRTTSGAGNGTVAPFTGGCSRLANNVWNLVLCVVGVRIGMAVFAL